MGLNTGIQATPLPYETAGGTRGIQQNYRWLNREIDAVLVDPQIKILPDLAPFFPWRLCRPEAKLLSVWNRGRPDDFDRFGRCRKSWQLVPVDPPGNPSAIDEDPDVTTFNSNWSENVISGTPLMNPIVEQKLKPGVVMATNPQRSISESVGCFDHRADHQRWFLLQTIVLGLEHPFLIRAVELPEPKCKQCGKK